MTAIFNRPFDWLYSPFESMHPAVGLVVASILTGVLLLVVYKYTSNQDGIRRTKDRIKAHFLEVRLFQDQFDVVVGAHWRIVRATFGYMTYALKPLAVILLPLLILMVHLEMHLGQRPLAPGHSALIEARFADAGAIWQAALELPEGIVLEAPAVRIAGEREITWRVKPSHEGSYRVAVRVGDETFDKQIVVGSGTPRVSPARYRSNLLDNFFYPSEQPLPGEGPLDSIEVQFPSRTVDLWLFDTYWMVGFFVFSIVAGLALKDFVGIEI